MVESLGKHFCEPENNLDDDIQKVMDSLNNIIFSTFLPFLNKLKKIPEAPTEVIHSNSSDPDYKVRKGWFTAVSLTFENIISNLDLAGLKIPVRTWEGMKTFTKYATGDFSKKELVPRRDVERANRIIMDVVTTLESEYKKLEQKLAILQASKFGKSR